jgi:hypothetical protein
MNLIEAQLAAKRIDSLLQAEMAKLRSQHPHLSGEELYNLLDAENPGALDAASIRIDAFGEEERSSMEQVSTDYDPGLIAEFPLGSLADPDKMREWLARLHGGRKTEPLKPHSSANLHVQAEQSKGRSILCRLCEPHPLFGSRQDAVFDGMAAAAIAKGQRED